MKSIIYDFGANCGQDIYYYLLKSDLVVAVEANKRLCDQISIDFAPAIQNGRLIIVNKALYVPTQGEAPPSHVALHVPKPGCKAGLGDAHATLVDPAIIENAFFADPEEYEKIEVQASAPVDIISQYGPPHYVKIDVEHYDHHVLRHLFKNNIHPAYISSECHNAEVLGLMISCEMYEEYKIVNGSEVGNEYRKAHVSLDISPQALLQGIATPSEGGSLKSAKITGEFEFKTGSSGPFGEDIKGEWKSANEIFHDLRESGLGWIDIHAKRLA